jgi:uncharacterized protein YjbI with pentapeptide repeats
MSQEKISSIPLELQQIKAYEIYLERISLGLGNRAERTSEKSPKNQSTQAFNPVISTVGTAFQPIDQTFQTPSEKDWDDAQKYLLKHPEEVREWKIKRVFIFFEKKLSLLWKTLSFPFWLLWILSIMFTQNDNREFALDSVKTIITAIGLIATFIAGIGLVLNYWSSEKNIQITQERLVTERFSKAIDQIGNSKEDVILGGIYSLERIAKDSPKDQATIMEILSSFVRRNSPVKNKINESNEAEYKLNKNTSVNISIQAALTVIARRTRLEKSETIDLSNSNLRNSNLRNSNLTKANLIGSYLLEANLSLADLSEANLSKANLMRTELFHSKLIKADLTRANLTGANLGGTNLTMADLSGADLSGNNLNGTDLSGADLTGTNLSHTDLSKSKNLTQEQLNSAITDKETKLPNHLKPKS